MFTTIESDLRVSTERVRKHDLFLGVEVNFYSHTNSITFKVSTFRSSTKSLFLASGPENLKKSRPKKNSSNQINQFHEKFFWPNSIFFCNFKNGQKSIFEQGKSLKQNNFHGLNFHGKYSKIFFVKLIYLISRVFWSGLFLIFWLTMATFSYN